MSNVEFSEEKEYRSLLDRNLAKQKRKGLLGILVRMKLARDETGALIILTVGGLIALAFASLIFLSA